MIKLRDLLTEKQFKGLDGIPANKSLEKISNAEKLNIIKAKGNIINFIVPAGMNRNFWQVISTGSIKKSSSGNIVMLMGGGPMNSPSFKTIDDLIDGVDWKAMEQRRRFNEGVTEMFIDDNYSDDFQSYLYKKYKGKSFNGWKLTLDGLASTFEWNHQNKEEYILATPFWDGEEHLPVEITNEDGKQILFKKYPFKSTGDMNKDELNYFKIMKQYLK